MDTVRQAKYLAPNLSMEKLAVRLGGRKNRKLSHSTSRKVHTSKSRVQDLMTPRLTYRIKQMKNGSKGLVNVDGGITFKSPKLAKTLKDCSRVVCFVATIGKDIEKEIKKLMHENHLSEAYIIDSMASVAVEDMVERFQKRITDELAGDDMMTTLRFSPGYCDWPITEQKKLFEVLDNDEVGVKISDSCLMSPRKSISGVFGIIPKNSPLYNPCIDCRKNHCEARRS